MFRIKFQAGFPDYAIQAQKNFGLEPLDAARAQLGPGLQPRDFTDVPLSYNDDPLVVVTETQARRAAVHFAQTHIIRVTVPRKGLNQYTRWVYYRSPGGFVRGKLQLDDQRVVEDWIAAGCPLRWLFPEEEKAPEEEENGEDEKAPAPPEEEENGEDE